MLEALPAVERKVQAGPTFQVRKDEPLLSDTGKHPKPLQIIDGRSLDWAGLCTIATGPAGSRAGIYGASKLKCRPSLEALAVI